MAATPLLLLAACSAALLASLASSAALPPNAIHLALDPDEVFDPARSTWMEQVGERPQVYYFHNFLSDMERRHMISLAAPQMKRSTVVGAHGESVVDNIRTSYGMFIKRLYDPIIEGIQRRISMYTQTPMSHQEDIQVLRYVKGQEYGAHYDSSASRNDNGPTYRMYTFYMYLSDVEEGGETAFPHGSQWTDPSLGEKLKGNGWSKCAQGNVAAKPKAGDAVLFWSFHRNGTMDPASMHAGCPVIKGIKWGAPLWVHTDEFRPAEFKQAQQRRPEPERDPGKCEDLHTTCKMWAESGECDRNPGFMLGSGTALGACRKACGACMVCDDIDVECVNRNRVSSGYLELRREEMDWLGVNPWGTH